jgi:hypothetical protein
LWRKTAKIIVVCGLLTRKNRNKIHILLLVFTSHKNLGRNGHTLRCHIELMNRREKINVFIALKESKAMRKALSL